MIIYEVISHYIDDYFVEHKYTYGLFKNKLNAENRMKTIKLKYKDHTQLIRELKIIERKLED